MHSVTMKMALFNLIPLEKAKVFSLWHYPLSFIPRKPNLDLEGVASFFCLIKPMNTINVCPIFSLVQSILQRVNLYLKLPHKSIWDKEIILLICFTPIGFSQILFGALDLQRHPLIAKPHQPYLIHVLPHHQSRRGQEYQ